MVRILAPHIFYYLILLLPLSFIVIQRHGKIKNKLLQMYTREYLRYTRVEPLVYLKVFSLSLLLISLVFSYSQPSIISSTEGTYSDTPQIVVLSIDVSKSMYAQEGDITRIERVIQYLTEFIASNADAQYMAYVFTDKLVQVIPLTNDIEYIQNILLRIQTTPILNGSTDFTKVVKALAKIDISSMALQDTYSLTFIFASDGESHTNTSEDLLVQIEEQSMDVVVLFSGSPDGSNLSSEKGRVVDKNGVSVVSYANPDIMQSFALATQGTFVNLNKESPTLALSTAKKEQQTDISWIGWLGAAVALFLYIVSIVL